MAEPSIVWMIHALTGLDGVKGRLSLEDGALVFRPDGGKSAETVLPVRAITRVHRAIGSPVLEVNIDIPNRPGVVGFYFIHPPRLIDRSEGTKLFQRYLAKRKAIGKLRAGNAKKKDEVALWVERIRGAKAGGPPATA